MTTLADAIAELDTGLSHADVLTAVRARTVVSHGMASGAEISGVLLMVGLLSLIEDQRKTTGEHTQLRNICIALEKRFLPDGQVNLSDAANIQVLDAFLSAAEVQAILTAAGATSEIVKAAIMEKGQQVDPEFPGITIDDVLAVREPALLLARTSNIIDINNRRFQRVVLSVTLSADLPRPVNLELWIRNVLWNWRSCTAQGITNVQTAGTYHVVLPADVIVANAALVKIVCPYAVDVTVAIED